MKNVLVIFLVFFSNALLAQVTPKAVRVDIKTPHATCEPCKQKIETFVKNSIDGLVKINVNYRSGVTTVQYFPDRTNIEQLKTAISNAGFDADNVMANVDVYNKLPACCKKPEDR